MASGAKSAKAKATADGKTNKKRARQTGATGGGSSFAEASTVAKAMVDRTEDIGAKKKAPRKHGRGKKYLEVAKLVDRTKLYPVQEAIDLLVQTSPVKFDATAEAHIQTGLDPKQADQNIRGTVAMPAGLGKDTSVLVFAEGSGTTEAKKAGADFVGSEDLIEKIKGGWLGFDVAIATPEIMVKIGKIGKILGTKGLMPNPKTGTVTKDTAKAIKEFKKGKVEFRLDKDAIIHVGFGKLSLGKDSLTSNFMALYRAIMTARPPSAKGTYLQKLVITSTMGPGIKVDLSSLA